MAPRTAEQQSAYDDGYGRGLAGQDMPRSFEVAPILWDHISAGYQHGLSRRIDLLEAAAIEDHERLNPPAPDHVELNA